MRKHEIWEFDKEYLQSIINESKSLSEVCTKLNLVFKKSTIKMISYRIKVDNLTLENLNKNKIKNLCLFKAKPLNDILIENSTYIHTSSLKKKLLKLNILENKCVRCGNNGEWMGEEIILHLDHINGISNDNRLDNLRILCPNCHSQTETYANKKPKKEIIDSKCKKCRNCDQDSNGKLFCDKCQQIFAYKRRKIERPNIDKLLNEVELNGYSATGKKYGVSDNTIRKWIKNK
jgi:hypothetical protein